VKRKAPKYSQNRYVATAISMTGALISMLVPLLYYPVMLNRLGKEQTGLWFSLLSLMFFLSLFDLGLCSLQARLAPAALAFSTTGKVFDDEARARLILPIGVLLGVFRRVFPLLGIITLAAAIPLGWLFLRSIHCASAPSLLCWLCLAASACISLGTSYSHSILNASVDLLYLSLPRLVNAILILAGYGVALALSPTIISLGLVYLLSCLVTSAVTVIRAKILRRRLSIPHDRFTMQALRMLVGQSAKIVVTTGGSLMLIQGSILLANWTLGTPAVADYYALSRLILIPLSLCTLFYGFNQPWLSAAFGRHEEATFRTLAIEATRLVTLTVSFGSIGLAVLSPQLMNAWSKNFHFLGASTAFCLAGTAILTAQEQGSTTAALCLNRVPFVFSTLAAGVLNVVLGFWLGRRLGPMGLALASAFALALTNGWYSPLYLVRHAKITLTQLLELYAAPISRGLLAAIAGGAVLYYMRAGTKWPISTVGWMGYSGIALFLFALSPHQRAKLGAMILRRGS
jgi:O-antigen/teichoic acid export membrane protein